MKRALIAMAVAGLTYAAVPTAAEASPAMPQQGLVLGQNLASSVAWHRRCWRDRRGRLHCRTCRRDRWGRMICR